MNRAPSFGWKLILGFYNLMFPLFFLLMLPGYFIRMARRGNYRDNFGERLALYSREVRARLADGEWIWIHAVSVGEMFIALKLIREIRGSGSQQQLVLSTTTTTGRATAEAANLENVQIIYYPVDFLPCVHKALNLVRPRAIILVEAEVWPNLTSLARRRGIPMSLVNARLSPRSERRYYAARRCVAPLFNQLQLICVQEPEDVKKWESFGVFPEKIQCPGSIKFDDLETGLSERKPDFEAILSAIGIGADSSILLGASTHPGEELALSRIHTRLREQFPQLFLILVPRHAERAKEILEELEAEGLKVSLRSKEPVPNADLLLVDSTGELKDWYAFATVVFVGKSLTVQGGHNPLEPVSAGKPVVFGPNMQNFALIRDQMLKAGATLSAGSESELEDVVRRLLMEEGKRLELVRNAQEILARHRGATKRTRELLALP